MKLRKLNDFGLSEFDSFIKKLRAGTDLNIPSYLLDGDEYSEPVDLDVLVDDNRHFHSRYEIGVYLAELFDGYEVQKHTGDPGFWSWFALLWFDQLCPKKNGKRTIDDVPNYVLSGDFGRRQRHVVLTTYQLVQLYGENVKFMLAKPPNVRGELTEQLMGTQGTLFSKGVMLLASQLYTDLGTGQFKRGAAGKGAGSARRYATLLNQLRLTYDIFCTTKEELEELLPKEFDRFRETASVV
jgi:hypothetical protein